MGTSVRIVERPSHRYRLIDFDGALSVEHIIDAIAWAPKLGFNGYFLELRCGHYAFDRWYQPDREPGTPSVLPYEHSEDMWQSLADEINRRGLVRHAEGHWTYEALGVHWLTYDVPPPELPPDRQQLLALVDGRRDWVFDTALFTQLCYSNPEVRRLFVANVVEYAQAHPDVTILHVWLGDIPNNYCECRGLPGGEAVRPLRRLAQRDRRGPRRRGPGGHRIAFLAYMDLLWPPLTARLSNPDRFVLMFAPITRTYARGYAPGRLPALRPYRRNRLRLPVTPERNEAHLRAWQKVFSGDSFLGDYHLWQAQYADPTGIHPSRVLHSDIGQLQRLGLNGMNGWSSQRNWLPTGLGMTVLGRTLWNRELTFDEIAEDYFNSAFGPEGALACDHLSRLADMFKPVWSRDGCVGTDPEAVRLMGTVAEAIDEFAPVIERNIASTVEAQRMSWRYLGYYSDILRGIASMVEASARGDRAEAMQRLAAVRRLARARERLIHRVFDTTLFESHWREALSWSTRDTFRNWRVMRDQE